MRQIQLLGSSRPCDEETIRLLEAEIRSSLPEEYRDFLKSRGGGIAGPSNRFIDHRLHPRLSQSVMIAEFYGADDVIKNWRTYRGRVPDPFLPIGGDHFGDRVCLSLSASNPTVAFWDHEWNDLLAYDIIAEIPPAGSENLMKIADTFAEFLDMLGEIPAT